MHDPQEFLERMVQSAPPLCDGLIDQNLWIGGDRVGHSCPNVATEDFWTGGLLFRVCASCRDSLRKDEGRVTLHHWRAKSAKG